MWSIGDPLECMDPPPSRPGVFINDTSVTVDITFTFSGEVLDQDSSTADGVVVRPGAARQLYPIADELLQATDVTTGRTVGCFKPAYRHCVATTAVLRLSQFIAC